MPAHVDQLQVQLISFQSCFAFLGFFMREFNCAGFLFNLGQINREFLVMLKTDSILDFQNFCFQESWMFFSQQRHWGLIGIVDELLD